MRFANAQRKDKPFADFIIPELKYLNVPDVKEYLKQPMNVKFDRVPKDIAQQ